MSDIYFVERNGKRYAYKSTSRYEPGKKYPVTVNEYVGRVDEATGEIIPKKERVRTALDHENMRMLRFGGSYVLLEMAEKMGLRDDLIASFGPDGEKLLALGIAQVLAGGPLASSEDVMEGCMIRELMGINNFSVAKMSEFIKKTGDAARNMETLFEKRVLRSRNVLSYDATSVFTQSTLKRWDRRRESETLRQADVGLVTDRNGIPVMFEVYPTLISDVRTMERTAERALEYGAESCTLVMGRTLGSASDLDRMLDNGTQFMMLGKRGTRCVKKLMSDMIKLKGDPDLDAFHDGKAYSVIETSVAVARRDPGKDGADEESSYTREFKLMTPDDPGFAHVPEGKRMKAFVCFSKEGNEEENRKLRLALAGIEAKLREMDPQTAVRKQNKVAGGYSKYIECSIKDGELIIERKRNALSFCMNRSGMFVMFTHGFGSWGEMMSCYDRRANVEQALGISKNELDGDRWKVFDPMSDKGRSLVKFIALVLWCGSATALRSGDGIPVTSALQSLVNIMAAGSGDEWRLSEITEKNKGLLKLFGSREPQAIYHLR